MGDHKAFVYGTLMAPEVLRRVCYGTTRPSEFQKSLLTVRPAILDHYERHRVKGCDYPGIIPSPDKSSSVRGAYVTGLTDGDIWRLDIFEGSEYKRTHVDIYPLESSDGTNDQVMVAASKSIRVETYVYIAGADRLEDGEWDFADFVQTKMRRWTGSQEYEEVDEAVNAANTEDPTGGRGQLGAITEKLQKEGRLGEGTGSAS